MNKGFQVGWWLALITVVSMYLIALPFAYYVPNINTYLLAIIGEVGIIIPLTIGLLYTKLSGVSCKSALGLQSFSIKLLPSSILLTIGAQIFITYITMPLQILLILLFGAETSTSQLNIPTDFWNILLAIFALCVVAPVFEELLCRGVIIKLFERYGFITSLICSSLVFALLHFEARSFIQIFFIGLLFGTFRLCTGSVLITIILHSLNNFISLYQLMAIQNSKISLLPVLIVVAAILFPFVFYRTFLSKKKRFCIDMSNFKGAKTGFSFGALILLGIFILYNVSVMLLRFLNSNFVRELLLLLGQ